MTNTTDIKEPVLKKIIDGMVLIAEGGSAIEKAVEAGEKDLATVITFGLVLVAKEIDEQLGKYYALGGTDEELTPKISEAVKELNLQYIIGVAAITSMMEAIEGAE
ncbi:hypothetical protein ACIU4M_00535 [Bacillus altitudinis]|uniref:hypothetical protein n=1 Tax=Bacillus altitudinis TaxID=293387 RepID=UPI00389AFF20